MKYDDIIVATFLYRKNRFIGICDIDGFIEEVHIANTGRGQEVFIFGVEVILAKASNKKRKTRYTLVSIYKGERLINIDSHAPNKVAFEAILEEKISLNCKLKKLETEKRYLDSRFDFYYEGVRDFQTVTGFIEVKGVTLEIDNQALFPDAPTLRGLKHLIELKQAQVEGFENYLIFIIQILGVDAFMPNHPTQPDFAEMLYTLPNSGVSISAYDCLVKPMSLTINQQVPILKYPLTS